jgi:UDP-N-acetyl-2-amino-2-deoxyglucuronate dehydrogenase
MEAEDTALALLRFTSGALGTIVASTAVYPGFAQQLEITGTNGTVIIEDGEIARIDLRTGGYGRGGDQRESAPPSAAADPALTGVASHAALAVLIFRSSAATIAASRLATGRRLRV